MKYMLVNETKLVINNNSDKIKKKNNNNNNQKKNIKLNNRNTYIC